jgi:hypothetical protein
MVHVKQHHPKIIGGRTLHRKIKKADKGHSKISKMHKERGY